MKLFLVKPGWALTNFPHQYAVLGGYLKQLGHQTAFYDASLQTESPETTFAKIDLSGCDAICLSIYTDWQDWARQFTVLVKAKYPSMTVIVGGPHISGLGAIAVEHIGADFGIRGEGELPLGKLLASLHDRAALAQIPGIIYTDGKQYRENNAPYDRVKNLDELPLPDYDLVKPSDYFHTYLGASVARRKYRSVQTITSRGCPYRCTFCATNCTWKNKITYVSPARVVEEIKQLVERHGIQEIWFGDDGFTTHRSRTMEICERMQAEKIRIPWRLPNGVRLDSLDDQLVGAMKKAGCYMTGIGVESGSPEMGKKIKKDLKLGLVAEKVRLLQKHGILTSGFFIIGYPEETPEELAETLRFILNSPLERMQITIFTPLPGSEEFDKIFRDPDPSQEQEKIRRYLYEHETPPFLKHLNPEMIQQQYRDTFLKFYLRPSILFSLARHMTHRQIADIFRHPGFRRIFFPSRKATQPES